MRVKYCCNAKAYENYYLSQVGHGIPYFSGARVQQGYGLGNMFNFIAKTVFFWPEKVPKPSENKFCKTVSSLLPTSYRAKTTSHLNVVVQSPSLHWRGSKWLVDYPRVSFLGDSPLDNSFRFLYLLSNVRSHMDSFFKPN